MAAIHEAAGTSRESAVVPLIQPFLNAVRAAHLADWAPGQYRNSVAKTGAAVLHAAQLVPALAAVHHGQT